MDTGRLNGTLTDKSGTATGSSTLIAAANSNRKFFYFQNLDGAIIQWINFGSAATTDKPSIRVAALSSVQFDAFCPTDAVYVIAASGGPKYTAKEG